MKSLKLHLVCLILISLIILPATALADQAAAKPGPTGAAVWSIDAKVKRLFNSHTSYEFGSPVPPYQEPLSRLEFALDSWWGGVEISRRTPLWSISLEVMRNLTNDVDGQLLDSDWTDDANTSLRTVYSESDLRMNPSYMVNASADLSVAKWLGLPPGLDLRPVGGVRWQRFDLTASNVTQREDLPDGSVDIFTYEGDVIDFEQTYWQYYAGLRLNWWPMPGKYPGFILKTQVDLAFVQGENWDHHLLRPGYRITEESTTGLAWHASLGLSAPLAYGLSFELSADYLAIETSGDHRWYDSYYGADDTWDNGVNVWSRQMSAIAALRYSF